MHYHFDNLLNSLVSLSNQSYSIDSKVITAIYPFAKLARIEGLGPLHKIDS